MIALPMTALRPILVLVALLPVLTSCSPGATSAEQAVSAKCESGPASSLVGKPKSADSEILKVTKAATVRHTAPGDMVTQDFREDRVTVETDPTSGLVLRAVCG